MDCFATLAMTVEISRGMGFCVRRNDKDEPRNHPERRLLVFCVMLP